MTIVTTSKAVVTHLVDTEIYPYELDILSTLGVAKIDFESSHRALSKYSYAMPDDPQL